MSGLMGGLWVANALINQAEANGETDIEIIPAPPIIDVNYATDFFIRRGNTLYLVQVKTSFDPTLDSAYPQISFASPEQERRQHSEQPNSPEFRRAVNTITRMDALKYSMRQVDSSYNDLDIVNLMAYVHYPERTFPSAEDEWMHANMLDLEADLTQDLPDLTEKRYGRY
jgi:hypothetical protein